MSIVDLVTVRRFNLYAQLMEFVRHPDGTMTNEEPPIYAAPADGWTKGTRARLEAWSLSLVSDNRCRRCPFGCAKTWLWGLIWNQATSRPAATCGSPEGRRIVQYAGTTGEPGTSMTEEAGPHTKRSASEETLREKSTPVSALASTKCVDEILAEDEQHRQEDGDSWWLKAKRLLIGKPARSGGSNAFPQRVSCRFSGMGRSRC